ncbi:BTB/POZ domain-containing protein POB1 [Acorus calamus]|uniref:BTB/POZ domain-containing protein POB1 n=1 Tax=Acorus calamus TaxID=4465 RepID=A0AAV9F659_ACOCL|nr:BTB/POZ domain-containing protein POB1 [Acorus calamus]
MDTQGNEQISFEFAFNNPHFSERTFRIEITDEKLVDNQINYITTRLKKRKINKKQVLEADEDEVEKKVLSMHVDSALLAVKSPFFYKLFSNGMRDSNNKCETTLKLKASEETPFKELLHFMYCGKFSSTDISNHHSLLDILILADKYEVIQCMKYCVLLLLKLPMTQESALLYLDLPSSVSTNMEVQQLMDASKKHLVAGFNDREAPRDELVNLSMAGLEVILSSDDILPNSEDEICDFLIDWARHNYLKLMERRVALSSLLIRFVRFPYLSCTCMRELLVCKDIDKVALLERITDSLLFKEENLLRKHELTSMDSTQKQFMQRSYNWRPVKVVESESPSRHSVVFFDLSRSECAGLFPFGCIVTQWFPVGEHMFYIAVCCVQNSRSLSHSFGVWLYLESPEEISVSYHYAVRKNPSKLFIDVRNENYTFQSPEGYGYEDVFRTPWSTFIAENSPYFINGTLHFRAEIIIETLDERT